MSDNSLGLNLVPHDGNSRTILCVLCLDHDSWAPEFFKRCHRAIHGHVEVLGALISSIPSESQWWALRLVSLMATRSSNGTLRGLWEDRICCRLTACLVLLSIGFDTVM